MTLQDFEGRQVRSSGLEMPQASGGLNKALTVDDIEWHHGDTGTLVIEYEVVKLRFDPVKDTQDLQRVHVLRITGATQIDTDLVAEGLAEQARRVEEAAGVKRLPFNEDEAADDAGELEDELATADA